MMGRTHLLLGFNMLWLLEGIGIVASTLEMPAPMADGGGFALCAGAAALGALLPDMDASSSLLQNVAFGGVRPLAPVARALNRRFGHRGFLHSLPALGVLAWLTAPLPFVLPLIGVGFDGWIWFWIWFSLLLGYLSHLLGDACTKSGVPLFWQIGALQQRSVRLLPSGYRLTTGSQAEEMVFVVSGALALALALRHLPAPFGAS